MLASSCAATLGSRPGVSGVEPRAGRHRRLEALVTDLGSDLVLPMDAGSAGTTERRAAEGVDPRLGCAEQSRSVDRPLQFCGDHRQSGQQVAHLDDELPSAAQREGLHIGIEGCRHPADRELVIAQPGVTAVGPKRDVEPLEVLIVIVSCLVAVSGSPRRT